MKTINTNFKVITKNSICFVKWTAFRDCQEYDNYYYDHDYLLMTLPPHVNTTIIVVASITIFVNDFLQYFIAKI